MREDRQRSLQPQLDTLEQLFAGCEWPERRAFTQARTRARLHALDILAASADSDATRPALLAAAADLIGALRVPLAASPSQAGELLADVAAILEVPRVEIAREVLRAPELLQLASSVAVDVQLGLLMAFVRFRSVSLWARDERGRVQCQRLTGERGRSRGARELAAKLLSGERHEPNTRSRLLGAPLGAAPRPFGALVAFATGERDLARALMGEATPMLEALLQREMLLADEAATKDAFLEASERRLVRVSFDLHDGPIQETAALADELRLFDAQLERVLTDPGQRSLVHGRIEDLESRVVALDAELRQLSRAAHTGSVLLDRSFETALAERVEAFAARSGVRTSVTLDGEVDALSTSQQIALLNIIQESLNNAREHAEASSVEIAVSADGDGVAASVTDDGKGFDPDSTLEHAAREGRIGLLAMNERARLLGGTCEIDSRPGGPTMVAVRLERWAPVLGNPQPAGAGRRRH